MRDSSDPRNSQLEFRSHRSYRALDVGDAMTIVCKEVAEVAGKEVAGKEVAAWPAIVRQ